MTGIQLPVPSGPGAPRTGDPATPLPGDQVEALNRLTLAAETAATELQTAVDADEMPPDQAAKAFEA